MRRAAWLFMFVAACSTTWRSASVADLNQHRHAFVVTDDHAYELEVDNTSAHVGGAVKDAWAFDRDHAGPVYKEEDPLPMARRLQWTHIGSPDRVDLDPNAIRYVRVAERHRPATGAIIAAGAIVVAVAVLYAIGRSMRPMQ